MRGRLALAALGVAAGAYGGWLLVTAGTRDLVAVAVWLGGGVVAHDAVLAPATLLGGVLAGRLLPPRWRGAAARAAVLLGPLTLLAVPVLGRFGARADNPTLLDRPYWTGWAVLVVLCLVGVALATAYDGARERRRATRRPEVT